MKVVKEIPPKESSKKSAQQSTSYSHADSVATAFLGEEIVFCTFVEP